MKEGNEVKPEPWIIEELEEEERRRQEDEESRRHRIELPVSPAEGAAPAEERERRTPTVRVVVMDISPRDRDDDNVVPV